MHKVYAVANCRVSSPEQMQSGSLGRQGTSVEEMAVQLGVEIIKTWSGSVSSKKWSNISRKDLEQMLDLCKKNRQIKYAIFDEVDRFMRSMLEIGYFIVEFKKLGVKVVFASQSTLGFDTAADTLLLMLEAYKAEGSNEERQRKSISGQTMALRQGRYPFSPKPGYKKGSEPGIPEIHPVRGPALRNVLIRLSSEIVTPSQALVEFNNSDFMKDHSKYKMDKFGPLVTDPFYAGIVEINKQVKVRNENGLHEPLITRQQHENIVRIMGGKTKNQSGPRKNGNPKYPCNNIVICERCTTKKNGRVVGFDHGNGKSNSKTYEKYRCRSCGRYISRQDLHAEIIRQFKEHPISKKGLADLTEALDIVWKQRENEAGQVAARLNHKIDYLTSKIEALIPLV